ncbi:MAG: spore coat protein [Bacilli bacterium]|nr:spore coat protein [Bacilli bacterium]
MDNNKISNTKTEVPTGKSLNDKDYINCLLSSLKEMVKSYSVSLTEASNENLYNNYKSMFDNYIKLQRKVYELMFRKGWYSLEKAETQKISSKIQMLNQEISDLNS